MGRARASEEGAGAQPRPLRLSGRCPGCRKEGECTPKQVILGECRCPRVDWDAYGVLLAGAGRNMPAWCKENGLKKRYTSFILLLLQDVNLASVEPLLLLLLQDVNRAVFLTWLRLSHCCYSTSDAPR